MIFWINVKVIKRINNSVLDLVAPALLLSLINVFFMHFRSGEMKYKIKKSVSGGESFIEHSFPEFPESFIGLWKKCGQQIQVNEGNKRFLCQSCLR